MLKRHVSWICAAYWSLGSGIALACGPADTLLGTHQYQVGDTPRVLRVDQNGTDLLIAVDNASGTTLFNHPNDRDAFELVYLEPDGGATQVVCVHSVFRNPDIRAPYTINEVDAARMDPVPLRRFTNAARLWVDVDLAARAQATAEYEALAALPAAAFPFRDHAALYAIRAELAGNQPDLALRDLAVFAAQTDLLADMPHVLPW